MRARFKARVDAAGLGAHHLFDHFGARAVRDVDAAVGGLRDHEHAVHGFDFGPDGARGDVVGKKRLPGGFRRLPEAVRHRGVFAVYDDEAVLFRDAFAALEELVVGDVLEVAGLSRPAGRDERLEGGDAGVGQGREVVQVPGNDPAHRAVVDPALIFGGFELQFERLDRRRGGDRVEGHLDERGDAARGHRLGAGFVAFPFGAARFRDVHVRVDHAGHHVEPRGVDDFLGRGRIDLVGDFGDAAVLDGDVHGVDAVGEDDAAVLNDQIMHVGDSVRTRGRRPAGDRERRSRQRRG